MVAVNSNRSLDPKRTISEIWIGDVGLKCVHNWLKTTLIVSSSSLTPNQTTTTMGDRVVMAYLRTLCCANACTIIFCIDILFAYYEWALIWYSQVVIVVVHLVCYRVGWVGEDWWFFLCGESVVGQTPGSRPTRDELKRKFAHPSHSILSLFFQWEVKGKSERFVTFILQCNHFMMMMRSVTYAKNHYQTYSH
jgi:hypothetical protein